MLAPEAAVVRLGVCFLVRLESLVQLVFLVRLWCACCVCVRPVWPAEDLEVYVAIGFLLTVGYSLFLR